MRRVSWEVLGPLAVLVFGAAVTAACPAPVTRSVYQSYPSYSYSYPTYSSAYVAPVVKEKKVVEAVATYVAVPFAVPVYAASYVPVAGTVPAMAPVNGEKTGEKAGEKAGGTSADTKAILEAIAAIAANQKTLDTRLRVLEARSGEPRPDVRPDPFRGGPAPAPAPAHAPAPGRAPGAPGALRDMKGACMACHQEGALAKDTEFVMFDMVGAKVPMSASRVLAMNRKMLRGEMPPVPNDRGVGPLTDPEYARIADQELSAWPIKKE